MKITILNGNPDIQNQDWEMYLQQLDQILTSEQHKVDVLNLRELDIRYCIGCFGCWVKSPGECRLADDARGVLPAMIRSDFILWASPLYMGFPSALLKKMMDRSIPLLHPYFAVDHNEAHHQRRYDHYPRLGLLMAKEIDTDAKDLQIVTDIFSRTALNLKSRLDFSMLTDQPAEKVAHAITSQPSIRLDEKRAQPTHGIQITPPSHLTVFNGSPRGRKGNTPIMLDQFLKGFSSRPDRNYEIFHLNHLKQSDFFVQAFSEAECVLLGFPLYTDAMPGIVKSFFESLAPFRDRAGNPPIGYLVQSGFPEAAHSRYIEQYLMKLAARLGSSYLGTIVKGGGEGVRLMPDKMNRKLFDGLHQIGKQFGETGLFEAELLHQLAQPERYPSYLAPVFKLLTKTSLLNFYWDGLLKQNGVYDQRFARPYETI